MFRGRIIGLIVAVLLIIGLLSVAGYAGWSQGYTMGRLAAGGEEGGVVPYPAYGFGFAPVFFGLGLFFKIALFLLLFLLIAKFFGFFAWRMAGGPPGPYWGRHKHWHRGRRPPWYGEDEPSEGDPEADIGEA